ncbi:unnamed protein product [Rhodiola kirilowii]
MQKQVIHQGKNDGGAFVQIQFHTKLLQLDLTRGRSGKNAVRKYSPNSTRTDYINLVLVTEEQIGTDQAVPEMVPDIATTDDIPESSNYIEHQTDNFKANRFFNLLNTCGEPAYEGCTTETELSINMKMLATKANYGLSEGAFNAVCGTMKNLMGGGRIRSLLHSKCKKTRI